MSRFESTATSKGGNGEAFEIPQAGSHRGVLIGLIDLGTQLQRGFQGAPDQDVHQVFLVWELVDARMSGMARNHTIGAVYRVSMHEKSKLRKVFEGWRGKPFNEGEKFDPASALGHYCMVNVVHKQGKQDGGTYAQVDSISGIILPQGQAGPTPSLPVILYEMGTGTSEKKGGQLVHVGPGHPTHEWIPFIFGKSLEDTLKQATENGRGAVSKPAAQTQAPAAQQSAPAPTPANATPF